MNSVADRLYHRGTATADLIRAIETEIAPRGWTLSRWQTSSTKNAFVVTITYAVHRGQRRSRFIETPTADVIDYVRINQIEGRTERCESYRALFGLLQSVSRAMGEVA